MSASSTALLDDDEEEDLDLERERDRVTDLWL